MYERDLVDWTAEQEEKTAEARRIYELQAIRVGDTRFIVNYDNSIIATVNDFDLENNLRAVVHLCHGFTKAFYGPGGKTLFVITWNGGEIDVSMYEAKSMRIIGRHKYSGDLSVRMIAPFRVGNEDALVMQIWTKTYKSIFSHTGTHKERVVIIDTNGRELFTTVEKGVHSLMTVSQGTLTMCRKMKERGAGVGGNWPAIYQTGCCETVAHG